MAGGDATTGKDFEYGFVTHDVVGTATHNKPIGTESTDDRVGAIVKGDLIVGPNAQIDRLDQTHGTVVEEVCFAFVTQHGVLSTACGDPIGTCSTDDRIGSRDQVDDIGRTRGKVGAAKFQQHTCIAEPHRAVISEDNRRGIGCVSIDIDQVPSSTANDDVPACSHIDIVDATNGIVERFEYGLAGGDATTGKDFEYGFVTHDVVGTATHNKPIGTESTDDRVGAIVKGDLIVGPNAQIDRLDQTHDTVVEEVSFTIVTQHGILPATGGDQISARPTDNGIGAGGNGNRIRCSLGVVGNACYVE